MIGQQGQLAESVNYKLQMVEHTPSFFEEFQQQPNAYVCSKVWKDPA
jgi:hypothetical protein